LAKYNRQKPCVFENLKTVFHGIPKNASTSIKHNLYTENYGKKFDGPQQWIHKGNEKGGSIYPSITSIKSSKYDTYTHFTVVRNPYSRFISFYSDLFLGTTKMRSHKPRFYKANNIPLEPTPINTVIDMVCSFNDKKADEHFASQSSFVYRNDVHIIKMETIAEEWISMCDHLNIAHKPLPVYNKSNHTVLLTEDQKNKIYNRYKEDFERFKYER
jgi:hypothetical protein